MWLLFVPLLGLKKLKIIIMGRAIIELLAYSILISRIYRRYSEALITETPNKHITKKIIAMEKKQRPLFQYSFNIYDHLMVTYTYEVMVIV